MSGQCVKSAVVEQRLETNDSTRFTPTAAVRAPFRSRVPGVHLKVIEPSLRGFY